MLAIALFQPVLPYLALKVHSTFYTILKCLAEKERKGLDILCRGYNSGTSHTLTDKIKLSSGHTLVMRVKRNFVSERVSSCVFRVEFALLPPQLQCYSWSYVPKAESKD